jgi:hypothetical protein
MNAILAGTPTWLYVVGMFLSNVLVGWIALEIARNYSRRERAKVEGRGSEPALKESEATMAEVHH